MQSVQHKKKNYNNNVIELLLHVGIKRVSANTELQMAWRVYTTDFIFTLFVKNKVSRMNKV